MSLNSIQKLYHQHNGKLSDKWEFYLRKYNSALKRFREQPVKLLEIGVQNGGSIEIWSNYFLPSSTIIGCDINPDCTKLTYDSPDIHIIIGDINSSETIRKISDLCPKLDIIIDDGSHLSEDIIKSFLYYFPKLEDNGIFIVEDLHCSYWQPFQGGLFAPYSSMTFFKYLADIINHEHWENTKAKTDLIKGFSAQYDFSLETETLFSEIHSIEFSNSMCIIRKSPESENLLGKRIIAGKDEEVFHIPDEQKLRKPSYPQINNIWSIRAHPPCETILETESTLEETQNRLKETYGNLKETQNALKETQNRLKETHGNLEETQNALKEAQNRLKETHDSLKETQNALKEAQNRLKETHGSLKETQNALKEAQNRLKETYGSLKETQNTLKETQHDFKKIEHKNTQLKNQIISLNSTLHQQEYRISSLVNSASWKLTYPFRFITERIKAILK